MIAMMIPQPAAIAISGNSNLIQSSSMTALLPLRARDDLEKQDAGRDGAADPKPDVDSQIDACRYASPHEDHH